MLDGRLIRFFLLTSCIVAIAACGDSDDDSPSDAGNDSGPPVTVVDSGTDAAAPITEIMCGSLTCGIPDFSSAAAGIDAGAIAGGLGGAIDPSMFTGMGIEPCCTTDNECGLSSSALFPDAGCVLANQPGTPDDMCPTLDFTFNLTQPLPLSIPGTFAGCCTPQGLCGINLSAVDASLESLLPALGSLTLDLGLGCIELTEADMLGGSAVSIADAGPVMSIACGTSDDGGADDGG